MYLAKLMAYSFETLYVNNVEAVPLDSAALGFVLTMQNRQIESPRVRSKTLAQNSATLSSTVDSVANLRPTCGKPVARLLITFLVRSFVTALDGAYFGIQIQRLRSDHCVENQQSQTYSLHGCSGVPTTIRTQFIVLSKNVQNTCKRLKTIPSSCQHKSTPLQANVRIYAVITVMLSMPTK